MDCLARAVQLVEESKKAAEATERAERVATLEREVEELGRVKRAAEELLGMREEEIEALKDDLADLQKLCREQALRLSGGVG